MLLPVPTVACISNLSRRSRVPVHKRMAWPMHSAHVHTPHPRFLMVIFAKLNYTLLYAYYISSKIGARHFFCVRHPSPSLLLRMCVRSPPPPCRTHTKPPSPPPLRIGRTAPRKRLVHNGAAVRQCATVCGLNLRLKSAMNKWAKTRSFV